MLILCFLCIPQIAILYVSLSEKYSCMKFISYCACHCYVLRDQDLHHCSRKRFSHGTRRDNLIPFISYLLYIHLVYFSQSCLYKMYFLWVFMPSTVLICLTRLNLNQIVDRTVIYYIIDSLQFA